MMTAPTIDRWRSAGSSLWTSNSLGLVLGLLADTIRPQTASPHWNILMCADRAVASQTPVIPAAAGEAASMTSSAGMAACLNLISLVFRGQLAD